MASVQKKVLSNGLTVLYKPVAAETVTLIFSVHTGSIFEKPTEYGLSHFLEHLLFEGTKKRPTSRIIAAAVENYGGEFNAATSHERTFYYVKISKQYFPIALDLLYDMFTGSLFTPKIIEKERKVIFDEINMINDTPRQYQWILFYKTLFQQHPASRPVYGDISVLKKMTRQGILSYFSKYYTPKNITAVIVGDVPDAFSQVEKKCSSWKAKQIAMTSISLEMENVSSFKKEQKKLNQSYLVLGYKTILRNHPESYVLDLISGILGRGQSGWLFDEIRAKRGLCYSIGIDYDANKTFGTVGISCGTHKKHIPVVKKLILEQLQKLRTVSASEVAAAKTFITGSLALRNENTASVAEDISHWHYTASLAAYEKYLESIDRVSVAAVRRFAAQYFTDQYTMVVLEQK